MKAEKYLKCVPAEEGIIQSLFFYRCVLERQLVMHMLGMSSKDDFMIANHFRIL